MREIGKNIRDLRQRKNMTQEELAEKLFVTRQTISNYETGRTRPDIEILAGIAECLESDVNTIIYGIPEHISKRREIIKTLIGLGAAIIFTIVYCFLRGVALEIKATRYNVLPDYLLLLFGRPAVTLIWGWSLMQGLSCFTGLSPAKPKFAKWLLRSVCIAAGLYVAVIIIPVISMFAGIKLPGLFIRVFWLLNGISPGMPEYFKFIPVNGILGAVIWLSGIGNRRQRKVSVMPVVDCSK